MFRTFIRSRTVLFSIVLMLAIGTTSIFIGKQFLQKQETSIEATAAFQRDHIQRNVTYHPHEMGLLLYYLRFPFINQPDKLAALAIGQRDVNPSIQAITIRTLEAQKYDTDLNNPANLLSGNLDFSFVIIYLIPLCIIAFTFNLWSVETEGGTWPLVAIQSKSTFRFLVYKLSIRLLLLVGILAVLFVVAFIVLSLPLNEAFLAFVVLSVLYVLFWMTLSFWVVSFKKRSSFNALTLLSIWVLLAIVVPASVNSFVTAKYPVPEALHTMVAQRDGYHEKWDMDPTVTMEKFYEQYPQYRKYQLPDKTFSWLWYYAMQQMGDTESSRPRAEMQKKISLRDGASHAFATVVPTMHMQLTLDDIAQTGLRNHLQYLDSTAAFHEKLRHYFYPKIFGNASVASENWNAFTPTYFSVPNNVNWPEALLPLLMTTFLIGLLCLFNFKQAN